MASNNEGYASPPCPQHVKESGEYDVTFKCPGKLCTAFLQVALSSR